MNTKVKHIKPPVRLITDIGFIKLAINDNEGEFYNVLMTPEIALLFLEKNQANRPVSAKNIALYSQQMKSGLWKLTMEPIKINPKMLIDGQHRLLACIKAGVAFPTTIATGVPSSTFDVQDTGKVRNAADVFSISGVSSASVVATTVRFLALLNHPGLNYSIANALMLKLYNLYGADEIIDAVTAGRSFYKSSRLLTRPTYAAFYYLFKKIDQEKAVIFLNAVATGEGLVKGDAALTLRNRLIKEQLSKSIMHKQYLCAIIIQAWNYFYLDKPLKSSVWQKENGAEFPKIIGSNFQHHTTVLNNIASLDSDN